MTARRCFICGAEGLCPHREPEVLRAEAAMMLRWERLRKQQQPTAPAIAAPQPQQPQRRAVQ